MYTTVLVLLRLHFILISIRVQVLGRFRQHKERRDSCRSLWATLQVQTSQDIHCTGLDNIISTGEKRIRHQGMHQLDTRGKAQVNSPENELWDTALQQQRGGQKVQLAKTTSDFRIILPVEVVAASGICSSLFGTSARQDINICSSKSGQLLIKFQTFATHL